MNGKRDHHRERTGKKHYASIVDPHKLEAGKTFRFRSNPGRQFVKDPVTGAVMSLAKYNERRAKR